MPADSVNRSDLPVPPGLPFSSHPGIRASPLCGLTKKIPPVIESCLKFSYLLALAFSSL